MARTVGEPGSTGAAGTGSGGTGAAGTDSGGTDSGGTPGDADLLAAVRSGDTAAYGLLYHRHGAAARRFARTLVQDPNDAEDLVAEAFTKVLSALCGGRGPQVAFRGYLLTAVRHARHDRARRDRRIELTGDLTRYEWADRADRSGRHCRDAGGEATVARLERSYAARAFAKLPERWRTVLWHTEVEGEKPAALAPRLGLSPNAVATLAYRARERLRQMYLQEHLRTTGGPSCHWTASRLGAHVRAGLAGRERSKVEAHLAGCPACRTHRAELAEVNSGLHEVLAPVSLLELAAAAAPQTAGIRPPAPAPAPATEAAAPRPRPRRLGRGRAAASHIA